jgi:thiamine transport system permease protein
VGSLFVLYLGLMTVVVLAPMATVVVYSFQVRTGWSLHEVSLDWYRRLFAAGGPYLRASRNSLFFGALTVAFSLPLGTVLAYVAARSRMRGRQVVEALMMLPMGVSSIILGLGYLSAFRHLPGFGDRLTGTWYSIVLAHTVIAYPFVIRATGAMFRKIRPSLAEAARSLGAGPWKVFWRLELPLARSALVTGAAFAFGISVGEINATLMLYNSRLTTMPVMIYRLIASYNFIGATAMGSLLMLLSFLAFLVIDRAGEEA